MPKLWWKKQTLQASVKPSDKKLAAIRQTIAVMEADLKPKLDAWAAKFGKIRSTRLDLVEATNTLVSLQKKLEAYQAWKDRDALRRQQAKEEATMPGAAPSAAVPAEQPPEPLTEKEMKTREEYIKVQQALKAELKRLEKDQYTVPPHVTVGDVEARFTKLTGAGGGASNEDQRLLDVEKELGKKVFGQGPLLSALGKVYRTREAGTSDPTRPAGVILVLGPPGCGKTEAVEKLAEFDGSELIDYAMGDFIDKSSVAKLVGASPGLVGFGETKTLPSAVREKPKSIVFLDEIEKAHEDMQKPLMQVNDKGKMKDEYGNTVSFKDTIEIMASNVLTPADFAPGEMENDVIVREKLWREDINPATGLPYCKINPQTGRAYFKKEVVGRIDIIVICNELSPEVAQKILEKNIRDINSGIASKGYYVNLDQTDAHNIVSEYFDPSQGGRSIKQLSNSTLRPLITERLLARRVGEAGDADDELKPMNLTIKGRDILLDGVMLADRNVEVQQKEASEPHHPEATTPGFKQEAKNLTNGGG